MSSKKKKPTKNESKKSKTSKSSGDAPKRTVGGSKWGPRW